MAAPYTEQRLADFVVIELGEVGQALSWTSDSPEVSEIITDAVLALDTDDLASLTSTADIVRVRAVARVAAWRAAAKAVAARYTFSEENGVKYDRSDLQKLVMAALSVAESESPVAETTPQVKVGRLLAYDPYAPSNS